MGSAFSVLHARSPLATAVSRVAGGLAPSQRGFRIRSQARKVIVDPTSSLRESGLSIRGKARKVRGDIADPTGALRDLGRVLANVPGNRKVKTEVARAGAALSGALRNPRETLRYTAPLMTQEEFGQISVSLEEAPQRLRRVLQEHGFAVVTRVVPPTDELEQLEEDFKRDLIELVDDGALASAPQSVVEAYESFLRGGPRRFPLTAAMHFTRCAGFALGRCLSHGRFAWRVRRHPGVHAAFSALYPDCGALVTSLDAPFFTPEGQGSARSNPFTAHVDQNANDVRPGLANCEVFQGALYIWPVDSQCSTTVVWPGSHRTVWKSMMNDATFAKSGTAGLHYSEIMTMKDIALARELAEGWQASALRVAVPAGALLLWNSRTLHAGWSGGPRLAQAVCLEPAARRPEVERVSKLRLAALGLPSSHWASVAMQHDMSLGDPGWFATERVGFEGSGDFDGVTLPLLPAIRPAGLEEGADMEALGGLVDVRYKLCGMWQPPEGSASLLEASVAKCYMEYL